MRLLIKTDTEKIYEVTLPNSFDKEKINDILYEAKYALPVGETITRHFLNSDGLTNDERKELDIYGEIRNHPIPLVLQNT